ncbi:MAG TPA: hypothetical protein EYQ52_07755 [Candidatus Thioglobus sp.]|nr:hypothetical protein [Candidatus Thioglobus sp.]
MKHWIFILIIFSLGSLADEPSLDSYQNNQVQQVAGQVYYTYEPQINTRVRQQPSLDSNIFGLLNNDDRNHDTDINHKDYKYTPYNEEWMKVLDFDGKLLGYSRRSLFYKSNTIIKYEDSVQTPKGTYKLEFIGHPWSASKRTYDSGNYYYSITLDDTELIYERGWKSNKRHLQEMYIQEGEFLPMQFHTLDIQGKRVGWLFGWNQYAKYDSDLDFSFARLIVPIGNKGELYTAQGEGFKFRVIADFLDKKDNQLIITEGHIQDTFGVKARFNYYHLPYQHLFTLDEDDLINVETGNIEISEKLIDSNPYYAYSIALNYDDYDAIRKTSSRFKDTLDKAAKECPEYDLTVAQKCPECAKEGIFRPTVYVGYTNRTRENSADRHQAYDELKSCLVSAIGKDAYHYLYFSTGLFPSQKVIDDYLENEYRYMDGYLYYLHKNESGH